MLIDKQTEKNNVCGIIGIIFASLLSPILVIALELGIVASGIVAFLSGPIVGIVLGSLALARNERTSALGIIAIIVGAINIIWGIVRFS